LAHCVRPADLLKPRRDLGVIHIGMIAAARADEFKLVGVAAFHPAVRDADRLAPEARGPAMAGPTSKRQYHAFLGVNGYPRITGMTLLDQVRGRRSDEPQIGSWPQCRNPLYCSFTHLGLAVMTAAGVRSSAIGDP
jgi:hypothetical protein